MKALVTEFFGNYTIQDLLGAAHAFRLAAAQLKAEGRTSQDALDKLVGKRDGSDSLGEVLLSALLVKAYSNRVSCCTLLAEVMQDQETCQMRHVTHEQGVHPISRHCCSQQLAYLWKRTDAGHDVPAVQLANGITQAMPDGAIHAQGNFVVLKLLEVAEPIDCMSLAGALLPAALRITGEKNKTFHGLEIMLKLVFKIVSSNYPLLRQPHLPLVQGGYASEEWQNLGALCTCLASSCMSCQQLSRMHKLQLACAFFRMLPSSCRCVRTCFIFMSCIEA